ncbi:hypothetical protein TeGR_g8440, partial [Tetraparma gracilis]
MSSSSLVNKADKPSPANTLEPPPANTSGGGSAATATLAADFYSENPARTARSVYTTRKTTFFGRATPDVALPATPSPVWLNIYELAPCFVSCAQCRWAPGVLCGKATGMGLFHSAVEFPGEREYTYNARFGLLLNRRPREACESYRSPMTYSYSIYLGEHGGGEEALMPLITRLHRRGFFKGNYNFIRRNCNTFCEQFLELLGLPMPP